MDCLDSASADGRGLEDDALRLFEECTSAAPYIFIGMASIISFGTVSRLIPKDSRSISPAAIRRRKSLLARY